MLLLFPWEPSDGVEYSSVSEVKVYVFSISVPHILHGTQDLVRTPSEHCLRVGHRRLHPLGDVHDSPVIMIPLKSEENKEGQRLRSLPQVTQ